MIWRDHKRIANTLANTFDLPREPLIDGSVEPDRRRTLTHTWPRARRTTRAALYRARTAFLKGNRKRTARFVGIVSHYIADGMVHETIDTFHRSKEHSQIEDELGGMVEVSTLPIIDLAAEGMSDGEFVFNEIDALVRDGLDQERLSRALGLLGSAVTGPATAPDELVATRKNFIKRINRTPVRVIGLAVSAVGALAALFFWDPVFLLALPWSLLSTGQPGIFRFLARYGWVPTAGALFALVNTWFDPCYLGLTLLLAGIYIYSSVFPDLSRLSEKWYRFKEKKPRNSH